MNEQFLLLSNKTLLIALMLFDFMEQITKIFQEFITIKESKSVELTTHKFIFRFQKTFLSGKTLNL